MAKATLPTNYRDDILNVSTEGKRKYRMNYNDDGTVSFVDVTPYDQEGSDFGAGDINATNEAVNQSFDKSKLIRDMDAINALTQEGFAPDALALKDVNDSLQNENNESFNFGYKDGVRGFFTNPSRADDCFIPFKSGVEWKEVANTNNVVNTIDIGYRPTFIIAIRHNSATGGALSLYKDGQILHCSLPGTTINNTVTLTVTDTGFTYKQTFTGANFPLEYVVF